MDITDIPIFEYLQYCRIAARDNGYKWIFIFLARELDAQESYKQLRSFWNSFDDLTGERILFLMSIAQKHQNEGCIKHALRNEAISNYCLSVLNREHLQISEKNFPPETLLEMYKCMAIEANTNYISELCRFFHVSERDVPSILIFDTEANSSEEPCIVPLKTDNLYSTIKEFIIETQNLLNKYDHCKKTYSNIQSAINEKESELGLLKISREEAKYIKNKTMFEEAINSGYYCFDSNELLDILEHRDKARCQNYPYPIQGYLINMIRFLQKHPNYETEIILRRIKEEDIRTQLAILNKGLKDSKKNLDGASKALRDKVNANASSKNK